MQPGVGGGDLGELDLLLLGEVLGVLPQRVACALEPLGEFTRRSYWGIGARASAASFRLTAGLFAGLVPRFAADLIERVGGPFDDVERIGHPDRGRAPLGDDGVDEVGAIGADLGDQLAALVAEEVEELVDGGAGDPQMCQESLNSRAFPLSNHSRRRHAQHPCRLWHATASPAHAELEVVPTARARPGAGRRFISTGGRL